MIRSWSALLVAGGALAAAAATATAESGPPPGQGPPPPPTARNGHVVKAIAHGIPTPTAFAFMHHTVFAGSGPDGTTGGPGGLFTISHGAATQIPGTPPVVFGLAVHHKRLYVSAGRDIVAYRGWNGTRFRHAKTIYHGSKHFRGFNGLAFGPDGRLYAGIALKMKYDHAKDPHRLAQAVVSMRPNGKHLRIVARGLRQPFQLTFPKGSRHPFVTVLAQDQTKKVPPDEIVVAKQGQDYGFPECTWLSRRACRGFAKPRILLPVPHASPMGIDSIGQTLYVALFGGLGHGPDVVTIPRHGGKPKPFMSGFVAPVIGLAVHRHHVYVGDLTGTIWKVAA